MKLDPNGATIRFHFGLLDALVDESHADAEEHGMKLSVGLVHEDVEDQNVLRSEEPSSHFISPYDVEVDGDSANDAECNELALPPFNLQEQVCDPWHHKE